jgi:catechol 2,3-dioxygenase-like lactoylglutathione lyase family enzyme
MDAAGASNGPFGRTVRYHHVAVGVSDLDASIAWYRDNLGFDVAWRLEMPSGSRVALIEADGVGIELVARPGALPHPRARQDVRTTAEVRGFLHLAFYVDDVDSAVELLERRGVEFSGGINVHESIGHQTAYFWDPDGNLLELVEQS